VSQVIGSPIGPRVENARIADPLDNPANRGTSSASAASWPAIFAGAIVAVAVSFILVALGTGLGFAIISPWPGRGASASAFTVNAAIWLIVSQWVSAAIGGYLAGRLRTRWVGTHTHEVFFRDTAHGLVTWSVATVLIALVLASSATSMVGGGLRAVGGAASAGLQGAAAGGAAAGTQGAMESGPGSLGGAPGGGAMPGPWGGPSATMAYDIDKLFRPTSSSSGSLPTAAGPGTMSPGTTAAGAAAGNAGAAEGPAGIDTSSDPRVEAVFIAFNGIAHGGISDEDRAYLAQLVQQQTGVPAQEAQKRVDEFVTATKNAEDHARAAVDAARKAAAETAIYTALALLVGAFIASVSAALGGRLRDEHP
jgi:hypothetical protein